MNKALLKKYLNQNCNEQELEQVKQFLQQPGSVDLFHEVLDEVWQEMDEPELNIHEMTNYRQRFMQELESGNESPPKTISPSILKLMKYAAILILPLIYGLYQLSKYKIETVDKVSYIESYNPKGSRSTITLTDGTLIYLGSNSKIRYPKTFSNTREMELIGEAFFNVKSDPERPFIIHTKNIQTKVLGTSFKIEAFDGNTIEVSVATGKVSVAREIDKLKKQLSSIAVLSPGRRVNWNEKTQKTSLSEVSIKELELWKNGVLTFNNLRLADVMVELERQYNVSISIPSNKLADFRINTTCSLNEPITKTLEILGRTAGFKYKLAHKNIIISNSLNP